MTPASWTFKLLEFYGTQIAHRGQWRVHAFLRRWLRADVDAELEVERDGHRWVLNPSDAVQSEFFWLGKRDTWDVLHATRLVRPGSVIFDIGSNFGHYAITLADALGRKCSVHSFEPFPPNMDRLRKNIRLNGLEGVIAAHPLGLSDSAGSGYMTTRADNSGAAALGVQTIGGHAVEVTTLDSFCSQRRIDRLDFLKSDVEGYEEKLLLGGVETISRFTPRMLIEFDPPKLIRACTSVDSLAGVLDRLGYGLWVAKRKQLMPLTDLPSGQDLVNVFCIHRADRTFSPTAGR